MESKTFKVIHIEMTQIEYNDIVHKIECAVGELAEDSWQREHLNEVYEKLLKHKE